jgi:hypothetical protein
MPGTEFWSPKFGHDPVAAMLYELSMDSSQDEETGTSESPIGWNALFNIETDWTFNERSEFLGQTIPAGTYILSEDSAGFVGYAQYPYRDAQALADWADLEDAYSEWVESDDLGWKSDTSCHPDCGPVVARSSDGQHAHENHDGRCWHDDQEGMGRCK